MGVINNGGGTEEGPKWFWGGTNGGAPNGGPIGGPTKGGGWFTLGRRWGRTLGIQFCDIRSGGITDRDINGGGRFAVHWKKKINHWKQKHLMS